MTFWQRKQSKGDDSFAQKLYNERLLTFTTYSMYNEHKIQNKAAQIIPLNSIH